MSKGNTYIKTPTQIEIQDMTATLLKQAPALESKLKPLAEENKLTTNTLLSEVLKFLYLVAIHKKSLTPSLVVDLAWHEFILCTKLYTKFCQDKFGRYIHHTPGGDEKENKSKFLKTIQLYVTYFKKPVKEVWGDLAHDEWQDSQCGTCKST